MCAKGISGLVPDTSPTYLRQEHRRSWVNVDYRPGQRSNRIALLLVGLPIPPRPPRGQRQAAPSGLRLRAWLLLQEFGLRLGR